MDTASTQTSTSTSVPAITFDPKSPSSLLIVSNDNNKHSDNKDNNKFTSLISDNGTGCNDEETRCIMRLIDIHNDFQGIQPASLLSASSMNTNMNVNDNDNVNDKCKHLSRAYRREIIDCIQTWERRINAETEQQYYLGNDVSADANANANVRNNNNNTKTNNSTDKEFKNWDLLKFTQSVMYLAEIYLCDSNNDLDYDNANPMKRSSVGDEMDMDVNLLRLEYGYDEDGYGYGHEHENEYHAQLGLSSARRRMRRKRSAAADTNTNTAIIPAMNTNTPSRSKSKLTVGGSTGTVTADTVRYIRYNHLPSCEDYVDTLLCGEITIEELLNLNQPEHWIPSSSESSLSSTSNIAPYWALVRKLVQRGLLNDAWKVLSRHSTCVRATQRFREQMELEHDSQGHGRSRNFVHQSIQDDMEAFTLIENLFSFAPLPGGRTESNDCGLGGSGVGVGVGVGRDFDNNDGDGHDSDDGHDDDDDDDDSDGDNSMKEEWWNGISASAHKLWDTDTSLTNTNTNSTSARTQGKTNQHHHDVPSEFNIYAVMNFYNSWKMLLSQSLRSNPALRNLTRRIPNLQSCVWDVILDTDNSYLDGEDSWVERLLAELIYVRPNIKKEDVAVRAMVHMRDCGSAVQAQVASAGVDIQQHITLEVMRGNAGAVIEALHNFGGGSGAALPATMTALLCGLLVENGQIQLADLSYDILTEKFLSASSAIIASFAMQHNNNVGIDLSTKLLQPYITPENIHITAHVADILCQHWPQNDGEVLGLLKIITDAVQRGSYRMLDACESLCFSRYLSYRRLGKVESSIHWLLRGVECASKLGVDDEEDDIRSDVTRSMCYRQLTRLCVDMCSELLQALLKLKNSSTTKEDASVLFNVIKQTKKAQDVIGDDEIVDLVVLDPSISLFVHVTDIGWNILQRNDKAAAKAIIHCLEERRDMDGSMITLSCPAFYGCFLSLAFDILTAEEATVCETNEASVSFDVNGMQVLFCCLDCYCNAEKYGTFSNTTTRNLLCNEITVENMRVALGKGLMRAFMAQNAQIGKVKLNPTSTKQASVLNIDQFLEMSM